MLSHSTWYQWRNQCGMCELHHVCWTAGQSEVKTSLSVQDMDIRELVFLCFILEEKTPEVPVLKVELICSALSIMALCLCWYLFQAPRVAVFKLGFLYFWVPRHRKEKAMAPHSSTLAWKIPWTEEPGRLQSMGSRRGRHNWATSLSLFTFMHWRRKWQLTSVFLPGESQGWGSLVGCGLWGRTELDTTEAT